MYTFRVRFNSQNNGTIYPTFDASIRGPSQQFCLTSKLRLYKNLGTRDSLMFVYTTIVSTIMHVHIYTSKMSYVHTLYRYFYIKMYVTVRGYHLMYCSFFIGKISNRNENTIKRNLKFFLKKQREYSKVNQIFTHTLISNKGTYKNVQN